MPIRLRIEVCLVPNPEFFAAFPSWLIRIPEPVVSEQCRLWGRWKLHAQGLCSNESQLHLYTRLCACPIQRYEHILSINISYSLNIHLPQWSSKQLKRQWVNTRPLLWLASVKLCCSSGRLRARQARFSCSWGDFKWWRRMFAVLRGPCSSTPRSKWSARVRHSLPWWAMISQANVGIHVY